jgi:uncharacterized protein YbjT (DUF2867 family)
MKIHAIITGATGMVGEGVLHECLQRPDVERILVINRRPCGVVHPKLREILHETFHDLSAIESHLAGYNAGFFCLGVSSVGMKETQYRSLTYDLTMHVADTLVKRNPHMTFCYVSGAGTSSRERGAMWARVKGKTENDLLKLPFKNSFMFRPGFIVPTQGLRNTLKLYRYLGWLFPIIKTLAPNSVCSLRQIGLAMIHAVKHGYEKHVLEAKDIVILSSRASSVS